MVDAEDQTIAISNRTIATLNRMPSGITRSSNSNIFGVLYSVFAEYETLLSQIDKYVEVQDLTTLINSDPLGINHYIDNAVSHLSVPRSSRSFTDTSLESNSKYWTRLIASRHARLSDGSYSDVANFVHALTGLAHPATGAVPVIESGLVSSIYRPYSKPEFLIHEGKAITSLYASGLSPSSIQLSGAPEYIYPPVAEFYPMAEGSYAPLDCSFSNTTTNMYESFAPLTWLWDFGDGNTSNLQNPIHTYSFPGRYYITLTATNIYGSSSSTFNFEVPPSPTLPRPEFIASPLVGYANLAVQFTNQSHDHTGADFAFNPSQLPNDPSYWYISSIYEPITLSLDYDIIVRSDDPENYPLPSSSYIAGIMLVPIWEGITEHRNAQELVTFLTDNGQGDLVSGLMEICSDGVKTYSDVGHYTSNDCTLTYPETSITVGGIVHNVTRYDLLVGALFGASPQDDHFIVTGALMNIGSVNDLSGAPTDPEKYTWDFGDGNFSNERDPTNTYTQAGTYTVSLSVYTPEGTVDRTRVDYITVLAPVPIADFTAAPIKGKTDLTVTFTNTSTAPTGSETYLWDFGDSNTSTEVSPTHTYTTVGKFTVTLTVTNTYGSDQEIKSEYIETLYPYSVMAAFSATNATGFAPLSVSFSDDSELVSELSGFIPGSTILWNFGDPTCPAQDNESISQTPTHIYSTPGSYTVSLYVTNENGEDTETKMDFVTVHDPTPICDFSAIPREGYVSLIVAFTDNSTNVDVGESTTWHWDFGDGEISTDQNPIHTYTSSGTYAVTLIVDNGLESGTITKSSYISVHEITSLTANFVANPRHGFSPTTVDFTDISDGNPAAWAWDFGDGSSSTQKNPSHTYNEPGQYTVTLTVSTPTKEHTVSKLQYVDIVPKVSDPILSNHCFWIELLKAPEYPIHLGAAIEGMKHIKPAGVCFKGFVFGTDKIKTGGYVSTTPTYTVECFPPENWGAGGENCIGGTSELNRWGISDWGTYEWGGIQTKSCTNSCAFYLWNLGFNREINTLVHKPVSSAEYSLISQMSVSGSDVLDTYAHINLMNSPPSQRSGGVFKIYEGYGHGGFGTEHNWNYYLQTPIETCWKEVLVLTGLGLPRQRDFTEEELLDLPKERRKKLLNLYPMNWISTNGRYKEFGWGASEWGSDPWGRDLDVYERENDCYIYIDLYLYCPTVYVTTEYPAVHVRCPKDTNLRDQKQIELDCIYITDDAYIFDVDVVENSDKPAGVTVDAAECIIF